MRTISCTSDLSHSSQTKSYSPENIFIYPAADQYREVRFDKSDFVKHDLDLLKTNKNS
jgi:hypothetical protein